MTVTAALLVLRTLVLVGRGALRAIIDLVVQGIEEDLDESVRVLTLQLVLARLPTAVLAYVRTALRVVEELVGWPAEVLLAMRVVALAPIVDR